jgi:hypothetical protein
MKKIIQLAVLLTLCGGAAVVPLGAQTMEVPAAASYQTLAPEQLDQLVGPIALYPDPLVAQILPAASLPTQIVMADRYIAGGGDPNAIDQQPWDASVQALARYPNVLKWMDDNLTWTTQLGEAFVNQQPDVMASIQRLRAEAQNLGNLQTTPQQQVVDDGGNIEILPADPQVIYVPQYAPDTVFVQSGYGLTFGFGFPIGLWLNCDFDWHRRHLVLWDHDHPRPAGWWHERPDERHEVMAHQTVWQPSHNRGVGATHDRGWGDRAPVHPGNNQPPPGRDGTRGLPPQSPIHGEPSHGVPPGGSIQRQPPHATIPQSPPMHIQTPPPAFHPPSNSGTFIGIQNPNQTRDFSNRGQESRQINNVPHSAPPAQVRPAAPPSGGNSHGNGGGDRRR